MACGGNKAAQVVGESAALRDKVDPRYNAQSTTADAGLQTDSRYRGDDNIVWGTRAEWNEHVEEVTRERAERLELEHALAQANLKIDDLESRNENQRKTIESYQQDYAAADRDIAAAVAEIRRLEGRLAEQGRRLRAIRALA